MPGERAATPVTVAPEVTAAFDRMRARVPELLRAYQAVSALFDGPQVSGRVMTDGDRLRGDRVADSVAELSG
jgi:hypothetical protein